MTPVWNFCAHSLGSILQGIPIGGVTCHYVSILRLHSSWIQSTQSKIDFFHCRFPLRFGFKGIFCPWLLSEVILGVANSKTADNTCPPGLTFWFVCLFVLLKGETYLGIKNIIQVLRMTQCLDRGVERGGGVEAPLSRKLSNFKNCLRYM